MTFRKSSPMVEVLIRLHRVLSEADKQRFAELFAPYVKDDAAHYVYNLQRSDVSKELEELGQIYFELHEALKDQYGDVEATINEFTGAFNHKGKLPYRGRFRTEVYAFCAAIGINFGRVVRHKKRKCRQEEVGPGNLPPMPATSIRKMLKITLQPLKNLSEVIKKDFCSLFTQYARLLSAA